MPSSSRCWHAVAIPIWSRRPERVDSARHVCCRRRRARFLRGLVATAGSLRGTGLRGPVIPTGSRRPQFCARASSRTTHCRTTAGGSGSRARSSSVSATDSPGPRRQAMKPAKRALGSSPSWRPDPETRTRLQRSPSGSGNGLHREAGVGALTPRERFAPHGGSQFWARVRGESAREQKVARTSKNC